jgi:hypothetical protein
MVLAADGEQLAIKASIDPRSLLRGQEGKVVLHFEPEEGIVIKSQPSFTIELDPSDELVFPKNFITASDLEIEILNEDDDEYLNLESPIEIPFTVNLDSKSGAHQLEGKVKYFAYSKEEKWCLKSTSKFSVSFRTSSRAVKKKS